VVPRKPPKPASGTQWFCEANNNNNDKKKKEEENSFIVSRMILSQLFLWMHTNYSKFPALHAHTLLL